jgi:hypothetical protein
MNKYPIIGILVVCIFVAGAYALNDNYINVGEIKVPTKEDHFQEKFGSVYQKNHQDFDLTESQELESVSIENTYISMSVESINQTINTVKLPRTVLMVITPSKAESSEEIFVWPDEIINNMWNIVDQGEITVPTKEQYLKEKFGSVDHQNRLNEYKESNEYKELIERQELQTTPPEDVNTNFDMPWEIQDKTTGSW